MKKEFTRSIESLSGISDFITEFVVINNLDDKIAYLANLVVEELFTNAVKYSSEYDTPVSINLTADSRLVISITYKTEKAFDIRETEEYDFQKKLSERKVGGLGIPLINIMMDEIDYEYKNGESNITLVKFLER